MSGNYYNIFYTDDDADDQEVFREVVADINEDIYIFTQSNGEELMEMLRNPPPNAHILFLDLNMPVMNGYEVLEKIRKSDKFKDLPVIVFSTSNDLDAINTTKKLGATLYVHKPGSYNEMKATLRYLLTIDWDNYKANSKDFVYKLQSTHP